MATAAAVAPLASSGLSRRGSITWQCAPSLLSCPSYPALCKPKPTCTSRTSAADVAAVAAYTCPINGVGGKSDSFGGKSNRPWDGRPLQRTRDHDRTMSRLLTSGAEPFLPVGTHRCVVCFAGQMGSVDEERGGDDDDRDPDDDDDEVGAAPVTAVGVGTEIVSVTELHDGSVVFEFGRAEDSKGGVSDESGPPSPPEELQEYVTDESHATSECKNEEMPLVPSLNTTLEGTGEVENQKVSATIELQDATLPTSSAPPHGAQQQLLTDMPDGEPSRRSAAVDGDDRGDHVDASAVSPAEDGGESWGLLEEDEGENTANEAREDTQLQFDRLPKWHPSSSFHKASPIPMRGTGVRMPSNVMVVGKGHAEGSEESAQQTDVPGEEQSLPLACRRPPSRFIRISPVRVWKTLRPSANVRQESALQLENSGEVSVEGFLGEGRKHHTPMAQRPPSSFRKVSPIPAQSTLRNAAQVSREEEGPAVHNTREALKTQTEGLGAIRGTGPSTEEIVRVQPEENADVASPLSSSGAAFHGIVEVTRQDGAASALQSFSVASEEKLAGDRTQTTSPPSQMDSRSKMQGGAKGGGMPHVRKDGSLRSGAVPTGDMGHDEEDSPVNLVMDSEHVMPFSEDSGSGSDSQTDAQPDMALKHDAEADAGEGGATVEDVHAPEDELAARRSTKPGSGSRKGRTSVKRGGRGGKKTKEDMAAEEMDVTSNQLQQDVQEMEAERAMSSVVLKSGTTRKMRTRRKEGREEEEEEEEGDTVVRSEDLELEMNVQSMLKSNIVNGDAEQVAAESSDSLRRKKAEGRRKKAGRGGKAGKNVGVDASGASILQNNDADDVDGNEVPASPSQVGSNVHVGDLATHNLSELKGLARELGVKGFSTMRKGQLVDALTAFITSSSRKES
ncbi:hypothetical protein CBR_g40711 [Chara braunii]|uniref:Rho termination factor-like N-terminal domain-containing protein n=1 Tax=Chara braunii TaxID=69332 RepID=A0A388LU98_CHABU|nr:hypothetical protein CBR_g40711 [Chara braunii]|eukprot:GBG85898.1 hypothetical protein CBR_g40711 [Chara braunii]